MLSFSFTKKISVLLVLLAGLYYALPNALNEEQQKALPEWLSQRTINLGLDLQGGAHLVLQVDVNAVYIRAYENLKDEIRSIAKGGKVFGYRHMRSGKNSVTFVARKVEDIEIIETNLEEELRDVEISRVEDKFYISFTPEKLTEMRNQSLAQTLEILRSRIDEFGVSEPAIQRQGETRVIVELPGIEDVNRAKNIIGRTAQLTFHIVDSSRDANAYVNRRPPTGFKVIFEEETNLDGEIIKIPYLVKKRPDITGDHLVNAQAGFDSQDNSPNVSITFDGVGTRKFASLTTKNTGRLMAIVLDGVVYSAPVLREPILGGQASISGNFTIQETDDLATVLRAGALPAPVDIVEERTVGPSLGRDSIEAGKVAIAVGFLGVMVLMLIFYRGWGMAANVALLFNVVLIIGIMTAIGATLTMPGIAGIVLTIGMAVDANVLIFERIREEFISGKSPRMAMDKGFESAFGTILDANITTLIVAVVLFAMGSGPIKGFALTLSVGIISSMFTAIMVTRMMLISWLLRTNPTKFNV